MTFITEILKSPQIREMAKVSELNNKNHIQEKKVEELNKYKEQVEDLETKLTEILSTYQKK